MLSTLKQYFTRQTVFSSACTHENLRFRTMDDSEDWKFFLAFYLFNDFLSFFSVGSIEKMSGNGQAY